MFSSIYLILIILHCSWYRTIYNSTLKTLKVGTNYRNQLYLRFVYLFACEPDLHLYVFNFFQMCSLIKEQWSKFYYKICDKTRNVQSDSNIQLGLSISECEKPYFYIYKKNLWNFISTTVLNITPNNDLKHWHLIWKLFNLSIDDKNGDQYIAKRCDLLHVCKIG